MEKEDELLEGQTDDDEGLFDISLDDLAPEDLSEGPEGAGEGNEEIIELMDLVEKGEKEIVGDGDDIGQFLEEDKPTEELGDVIAGKGALREDEPLSQSELDLANLSLDTDIDLDAELEQKEEDTEGPDLDESGLDEILGGELSDEVEPAPENSIEAEYSFDDLMIEGDEEAAEGEETGIEDGAGEDISEIATRKLFDEEIVDGMEMTIRSPIVSREVQEPAEAADSGEPDSLSEPEFQDEEEPLLKEIMEPEKEESHAAPQDEVITGISEEKIEAIVKKVLGDVVERVTRETIAEVAERVITETIDALKQSLERDRELR